MKKLPNLSYKHYRNFLMKKYCNRVSNSFLVGILSDIVFMLFAQFANAQSPNISYPGSTVPKLYTVGTAISSLTPTNSGGSIIATGLTSTVAASVFNSPYGTAVDASGDIYIADAGNNMIKKVSSTGVLTIFAGNASSGHTDGTGAAASFYHPTGVCVDGSGNVYVADDYNNEIRKITSAGVVTTLAGNTTSGHTDGTGGAASFNNPTGICVDGSGNLYVADFNNNEIRKVTSAGVVTTIAGSTTSGSTNATGTSARFNLPFGICIDGSGNFYIADKGNNMIRKMTSAMVVTTLAGSTTAGNADGTGTAASFNAPAAVGVYGSGNIFVADGGNNLIRMITSAGVVTTYAGKGFGVNLNGLITQSSFNNPSGLCVDASGIVYVGDNGYGNLRKIIPVYYAMSPALPGGLTMSSATGVISGTPNITSTATTYTVTVYGTTGSATTTLNISSGLLTSYDQGNRGFVQQEKIKVSGITQDSMIYALTTMQKQTTRTYYDGMGRTLQNMALQASPLGQDMIQATAYDNLGRQIKGYLPYTGQSSDVMGSYRPNALTTDQHNFYNNTSQYLVATDTAAYAQQVYESSPLQRVLEVGSVGIGFQPVSGQHYKTVKYRYNNSGDLNILIWNPDGTFTTGNYYAITALSVTDGIDEDGSETLIFTDKAGHTILKRQILASGNLDTYYLYNTAGMLSYIIPPKAFSTMVSNSNYSLTQGGVNQIVFKYVYDTMGRPVEKTVPGKGVVYIVYDPINRPVLTQDSSMRVSNQWAYAKYDAMGRAINTGTYISTYTTRVAMQNYVNGLASSYSTTWFESRSTSGSYNFYTNVVFPTTITPLVYIHFDDYYIDNTGTPDFSYVSQGLTGEVGATSAPIKGMPTAIAQAIVGAGITSGNWLCKIMFYDKRGNLVQTQTNNELYYQYVYTPTDYTTVVPDFVGVPQITKVFKKTSSTVTTTVQTNLTYDQMYRITSVSQAYNGGTMTQVAGYSYNEIGQVIQKKLGYVSPSSWLQNVDMRFNIRGQLLSINNSKLSNDGGVTNSDTNDLFGMAMLYDQVDSKLGNTPYFNGKVSAVKWMSRNASASRTWERAFKYNYDGVNRYLSARYAERDSVSTTTSFTNNVGGFDEVLSYDNAGNITTLTRNSSTQGTNTHIQIDTLTYSYDASRPYTVHSITDGTDANHTGAGFRNLTGTPTYTYTYDGNGNETIDPYKGLTITYDVLNKTDKIAFSLGTNRWIDYTYDASGNLLRKRQYDNNILQTTTDYIDGFVYVTAGAGTPALAYFPMPEGRVINTGTGGTVILTQEFIIGDQQGNARLSFQNNGAGKIAVKQENSYYPTGLIMPNSPVGTPTIPNKLLYNGGSEWQNDFSNSPDFYLTFNRNYDAAVGRFIAVDPMAESAESMTSYQYAGDNPVMFNDPLGDNLKDPARAQTPASKTEVQFVMQSGVGDGFTYGDLDIGGDATDAFAATQKAISAQEQQEAINIDEWNTVLAGTGYSVTSSGNLQGGNTRALMTNINFTSNGNTTVSDFNRTDVNVNRFGQVLSISGYNSTNSGVFYYDAYSSIGKDVDGNYQAFSNITGQISASDAMGRMCGGTTKTWDPVTDQRIAGLDPRLRQPATNFINAAQAAGTYLRINEGFRSFATQNDYYAQGRTKPGSVITNAKGGQSYHNYGLAFDVVIMENGQPNWNKTVSSNVANLAIGYGFEWGGNWNSFKDYPHFQMTFGQSISTLNH